MCVLFSSLQYFHLKHLKKILNFLLDLYLADNNISRIPKPGYCDERFLIIQFILTDLMIISFVSVCIVRSVWQALTKL